MKNPAVTLNEALLRQLLAARAGTPSTITLWAEPDGSACFADNPRLRDESNEELIPGECRLIPMDAMDWELQGMEGVGAKDDFLSWIVFTAPEENQAAANRGPVAREKQPEVEKVDLPGTLDERENLLESIRANSRLMQQGIPVEIRRLRWTGSDFIAATANREVEADEAHQERTLLWLGRRNLGRIREASLGIIGAGGVGNQFVLAAMHHGFRRFVIADADTLDGSNLNRFQSANASDIGQPKARLLERAVRAYAPDARVSVFPEHFPAPSMNAAFRKADALVCGVDNDGARFSAQLFALRYGLPLFDMGSGIMLEEGTEAEPVVDEAGGQVRLALPGGPCLVCLGLPLSDLRGAHAHAMDAARGYLEGTDLAPPSVITLNSVTAALCLRLLVNVLTGAGAPVRHLRYDEKRLALQRIRAERLGNCPVCGIRCE